MPKTVDSTKIEKAIFGCLLGTAVGDALGLPMEGVSKSRQRRLFRDIDSYHLVLDRGAVSDDTEHACITACALAVSGGEEKNFTRALGGGLRKWFMCLPPGIGFATLRSLMKLLIGISPEKSGVFSAGNGPAMRSPVIGVCFGNDPEKMKRLVRISTRITHTDPKAEHGAVAVALAAYMSSVGESDPGNYLRCLKEVIGDSNEAEELISLIESAAKSVASGESTEEFAESMGQGKGVTGYMYHTVPVVLHAWLSNPQEYMEAVKAVIKCGGDTDTTAAIAGGIVGAATGMKDIGQNLKTKLVSWPATVDYMEEMSKTLSESPENSENTKEIKFPFPKLIMKNLAFFPLIILLALRRLFPPY